MKLLVATEFPPNASGGGPAVVRQMLRDWPEADLSWWSCLPERDRRFGQSYRRHFCAPMPAKLVPQRRLTQLRSALLDWFWAPRAACHLTQTLRELRPDAVWVVPHNLSILPLASVLPGGRSGFHVTVQDYVDAHGQDRKFGAARCRRMSALADRIYASATTRDATSHPMLEDLRQRTGASGMQMMHAGVEADELRALVLKRAEEHAGIRIAYAGTILVPEEFALFVEAVRTLRGALPKPVTIEIFGAHSYAHAPWFDPAWMRESGDLPEPELLARLRTCTWGFAPMSLTDSDPRYNRYSFPTKFITYLAAGLPILTLGHPESAVMKMARRYDVGHATPTGDVTRLEGELRGVLSHSAPWAEYGPGIVECAETEFRADRMRGILRECFEDCARFTRAQGSASTRQ